MTQEVSDHISKSTVCANHPRDQAKEPLITHHTSPSHPGQNSPATFLNWIRRTILLLSITYPVSSKSTAWRIKQVARSSASLNNTWPGVPSPPPSSRTMVHSSTLQHLRILLGNTASNMSPAHQASLSLTERSRTLWGQPSPYLERPLSPSDPYLALLGWWNTLTEGLDSSPAQRLFSRRTRTLLPTTTTRLKPAMRTDTLEKMTRRKAKQALYFNFGAKELTELNPGDVVGVKPLHASKRNSPWLRAQVQGKVDIRSYQVRTEDGQVYRRNRRHLSQKQDLTKVDPPKSVSTDALLSTPTHRASNHLQRSKNYPTRQTPTAPTHRRSPVQQPGPAESPNLRLLCESKKPRKWTLNMFQTST